MHRSIRRIATFAVAATALAGVLAIPASSDAASSKTCKISGSKAEHLGPTYVLIAENKGPGYKVTGTTCATGLKVVKAFHACRLKHGKAGKCTTKVLGFSCTEKRPAADMIPTQFTGNVICKKGKVRVTHTYQQNT